MCVSLGFGESDFPFLTLSLQPRLAVVRAKGGEMMGPFIGGIILVIIIACLIFIFAAPLYTKIGAGAEKIIRPFLNHKTMDEKEDDIIRDNRNGEK